VTTEFYISGTEPTRECDKHGPYANPGLVPIDTFSTVPYTPPSTSGSPAPIRVTPPPLQPGYEPVPSNNQQRAPTVFDTTRRGVARRDSARRDALSGGLIRVDTSRNNPARRDTARGNVIRRDSTRPTHDTVPTVPPPARKPR
jgi:hypothetical protein